MGNIPKITLFVTFYLIISFLSADIVQIGQDNALNQCLPIEPLMSYSYSQSIYKADEIGITGTITSIGFQYSLGNANFLPNNNLITLYAGITQRETYTSLTDWFPTDSLQIVFQGTLIQNWLSGAIPGQGWLTIPLTSNFNYNGTGNLIIAFDENNPGSSASNNDFKCSSCITPQSIEFHSMTVNPDPANPPEAYTGNPKLYRPNLKLDIQSVIYTPHSPVPLNDAVDITLTPTLEWQSNAQNWDIYFSPANQPLQAIATNLDISSWSVPNTLNLMTQYHWQVISHFNNETYPGDVWSFTTMGESLTAPQNLQEIIIGQTVQLEWEAPTHGSIISYRIYRNQILTDEVQTLEYTDDTVSPGQTYWYYVVAVNYLNQLSPPSNIVSASVPGSMPVFQMNFDNQTDFAQTLMNWTMYDLDHSQTWQWNDTSFPHEGESMSWIVFNPGQTTPPLTGVTGYSGQKMMLCIDSTNPPNNDWLISPHISISNGYNLSFWIKSYSADYGMERLRFLISTSDTQISSFSPLSTEPWLNIPAQWTQINYDLSAYAGQQIYLAWQCVSWDAFALCLDEIVITLSTANEDDTQAPIPHISIYPNPAHDHFTIDSKDNTPFDIEIYNIKGQRVSHTKAIKSYQWNKQLQPGIYLINIKQNNSNLCKRILIL